ncbi:uncharacterized protein VTP21DRAFT_8423 [Calcarisporiella thermophila]|uniref:uncharacterized protein n=1 Tax=Calcarisporiella thermophila TaxID=911321 RepID=UPI00374247A8
MNAFPSNFGLGTSGGMKRKCGAEYEQSMNKRLNSTPATEVQFAWPFFPERESAPPTPMEELETEGTQLPPAITIANPDYRPLPPDLLQKLSAGQTCSNWKYCVNGGGF